jgi:hypothetical protein
MPGLLRQAEWPRVKHRRSWVAFKKRMAMNVHHPSQRGRNARRNEIPNQATARTVVISTRTLRR